MHLTIRSVPLQPDIAAAALAVDGARIILSAVSEGFDRKQWAREPHVTTVEGGVVISR